MTMRTTTKEPGFDGTWLVTEYVYEGDGRFAGIVHQRRILENAPNNRIRVIQYCEPDEQLRGNAMESFRGRYEFEVSIDGNIRRYHGVDVVGTGRTWGKGAMTGRGNWPRFGHNFSSFSVLGGKRLQLTGGKFFRATEQVANIIGVGVPQSTADQGWPELKGPQNPAELSCDWAGTYCRVDASGLVLTNGELTRYYFGNEIGFVETRDDSSRFTLVMAEIGSRIRAYGHSESIPLQGFGKRYGWSVEMELSAGSEMIVESMELLDAMRGKLIVIRRWLYDQELRYVDIIRLEVQGDQQKRNN